LGPEETRLKDQTKLRIAQKLTLKKANEKEAFGSGRSRENPRRGGRGRVLGGSRDYDRLFSRERKKK